MRKLPNPENWRVEALPAAEILGASWAQFYRLTDKHYWYRLSWVVACWPDGMVRVELTEAMRNHNPRYLIELAGLNVKCTTFSEDPVRGLANLFNSYLGTLSETYQDAVERLQQLTVEYKSARHLVCKAGKLTSRKRMEVLEAALAKMGPVLPLLAELRRLPK